jgi:hypothetical protein
MEQFVTFNIIIFLLISAIPFFRGLDLKKWTSWIFGLYGYVTGFFAGLNWSNLKGAVLLGFVFAFIVLYGGATTHWHRQNFKE